VKPDLRPHLPWLLAALALAAFLPALAGGLVFDDHRLIAENRLTGAISLLPELLRSELWASTGTPEAPVAGLYRPLMLLSLALDRALGGAPWLAHLHSLLWHALNGALSWRLLRALGLRPDAAALGLAIFLLHPIQVEAVVWLSARNDLIATAGLLGALLFLLPEPGPARPLPAALCLGLGLLAKESVALGPLIYALLAMILDRPRAELLRGVGALGLALLATQALRLSLLGPPPSGLLGPALERAPTALAMYLPRLIQPWSLAPGLHTGWPPALEWGALLVGLPLLTGALALAGRRGWMGLALALLAAGPSLLGLAAFGQLGDRYLYPALLGLGLIVGAAAERGAERVAPPLVLGALLALCSARVVPMWSDDHSYWWAAVHHHPSSYTRSAFAKVLEEEGDLSTAAGLYAEALEAPPFPHACYNALRLQLQVHGPAAAAELGPRALQAGCPPVPELMAPWALSLALTGRWEEAEEQARAVSEDPTGLAVVVRVAADLRRGSDEELQRAIAAHPEADPQALRGAATSLLAQAP
jgi:protein O-mannosyl-transferase